MKSNKAMVNDKEFLVCFLADATYDTYWAKVSVHTDNDATLVATARENNECREDVWADVLLGGGFLKVYDCEDGENHKIDLKAVEKGFNKLMRKYPRHYANIKEEDYDFFDVDALLQVIVFGDVIYG